VRARSRFSMWTLPWRVLLPRDFVCGARLSVPSRLREPQRDGSCPVPRGAGRQRSVHQHGLDVRVQPGLHHRGSLPKLLRGHGVPVQVGADRAEPRGGR